MGTDFTDLVVWREATLLAANVHVACKRIRGRSRSSAADQMIRAAESVGANLVEGIGRGVSRDGLRFLRMSRASALELEHHVRQARLTQRFTPDVADSLVDHTRRVRYLLRKFHDSVERRLQPPPPQEPQEPQ